MIHFLSLSFISFCQKKWVNIFAEIVYELGEVLITATHSLERLNLIEGARFDNYNKYKSAFSLKVVLSLEWEIG